MCVCEWVDAWYHDHWPATRRAIVFRACGLSKVTHAHKKWQLKNTSGSLIRVVQKQQQQKTKMGCAKRAYVWVWLCANDISICHCSFMILSWFIGCSFPFISVYGNIYLLLACVLDFDFDLVWEEPFSPKIREFNSLRARNCNDIIHTQHTVMLTHGTPIKHQSRIIIIRLGG